MTKVLHVTPHLGGGVGKAVSGLVSQIAVSHGDVEHKILCLEEPENDLFVKQVRESGGRLGFCPSTQELIDEMGGADIVQLEFWGHPAIFKALCAKPLPEMRLLVWCHISGLHFPHIPSGMLSAANRFVFTSACSFESPEVQRLDDSDRKHLQVVSSGGGMEALPMPSRDSGSRKLQAGYLGTSNFSKLHPDFISFLCAVEDEDFHVSIIGEEVGRATLERQCRDIGRENLVKFKGYTADISSELAKLDVLAYLLNPFHYGTAENALLEAMAMGVVPVVLNNISEKYIVEDGKTGIVVRNPDDFAAAVQWLSLHGKDRARMSQRAAETVRKKHSLSNMVSSFNKIYADMLGEAKKEIHFNQMFGGDPADAFLTFCGNNSVFLGDGGVLLPDRMARYALYERAKGSVFHFLRYFPDNMRLKKWAAALELLADESDRGDLRESLNVSS